MRVSSRSLTLTLSLSLAAACGPASAPPAASGSAPTPRDAAPASASTNANATASAGIRRGMNPKVQPGDDFFAFANGEWIESTPIPQDRSSWGVMPALAEQTNERNAQLVKGLGESTSASGDAKKIADTYATFMDEATIESKGLAPIEPALKDIERIKDRAALARALGATVRADVDVLNNTEMHTDNVVGLWVAEDLDDPTKYAAFLLQGGLGMPDREYYVDASPRMTDLRAKYQAHIGAVLGLAHVKDAKAKAARIFELEKKIAQEHAPREDVGDVEKGNNHWSRKDFDTKAPGMDWNAFFAGAGLEKQRAFVAWTPKHLTSLAALVAKEPLDTWKDYLAFHALDQASPFLPKAFVDEHFAFHAKAIAGVEQIRDRWKRAIDVTNDALGEAVGKLYVEKYFPASEKARAKAMVKNIVAAFGKRIEALTWMNDATKSRAKAKLATLEVGIGYPDRFRDYGKLEVVRGDALGNVRRASKFEYERNKEKLEKPVDRGEWVMLPQLVNAVNLPVRNALQFPAAILQPPFLDPTRPESMDYGAAGAIIGHEISHSFDDQGALFDETGKLHNWWTADDLAHFKASGAALIKQFDAYKPFPDAHVNGKQTLGENIADVAGLSAAYDAYLASLGGRSAPVVDGFTGPQQFFISFAQGWRSKIRPNALRSRLVTDGHAPPEYRSDTVRNLDAWYEAFAPKPGQALFLAPADRVRIW